MYTIKMSIVDENNDEINYTVLAEGVANRRLAFILLAEWSNAIKQILQSLFDKQKAVSTT